MVATLHLLAVMTGPIWSVMIMGGHTKTHDMTYIYWSKCLSLSLFCKCNASTSFLF